MRLYVYEGTPEEIGQIAAKLPVSAAQGIAPVIKSPPPQIVEAEQEQEQVQGRTNETRFVDAKIARKVLSRRRLSPEQREVLKAIYRAYPNRVAAPDLQRLLNYTTAQFAGLMGAFGRRLTHTDGYVEGTWFFDQEWDYEQGFNMYGLPGSVRDAVERENLF